MSKVLFKTLDSLARLSLGIALLWVLFQYAEINSKQVSIFFRYDLVFYAILLKIMVVFLMSYRWMIVLRSNKIEQRLIDSFKFTLIGQSLMVVLPGVIAQDVSKVIGTIRSTNSSGQRGKIIALSIVDRLIGIVALLVSSILLIVIYYLYEYMMSGFTVHYGLLNWVLFFCLTILFCLAFFYYAFNRIQDIKFSPKIIINLLSRVAVIADYLYLIKNKDLLLYISILSHLFNAFLVVIIVNQLLTEIHVLVNVIFGLISNFGNFFPLTPGGLGITESVFMYLYSHIGYDLGLVIGLSYRFLSYTSIFILTAIFIFSMYVYNTKQVLKNN